MAAMTGAEYDGIKPKNAELTTNSDRRTSNGYVTVLDRALERVYKR